MTKKKPSVFFHGFPVWDTTSYPEHEVAHVYADKHYVWGKGLVRTSSVLEKFPDGSFETLNTIYIPIKDVV
jgi:hypothetical protein